MSDFIAPKNSKQDYIGFFAVTVGHGIEDMIQQYREDHNDYMVILVQSVADRLAEAFAELMHLKVRREWWGYAKNENLPSEDIIAEKYQGIRPAHGYPACPDHTEKRELFELLKVEENAGITLSENLSMYPASSVSGVYYSHPESKYFGVGKIKEDQLVDYAKRKKMDLQEIKSWLSHYTID